MRLAPLPAEDRLTLELHEGQQDAPVFVYRPLSAREVARWTARLYTLYDEIYGQTPAAGAEGAQDTSAPRRSAEQAAQESFFYLDLFEERTVRIENLQVGDAHYDHANAEHRGALPLNWQVQAGAQILNRAQLSEEDQGKSSSPSASD